MNQAARKRINLSLDSELAEFAQKWSEVTQTPISRLVDDFLQRLKNQVTTMTPEEWLAYQDEQQEHDEMEFFHAHTAEYMNEWIKDKDEEKFCVQNPNSDRAKRRRAFLKELERRTEAEMKEAEIRQAKNEKERKEFIARWKQIFLT